MSAPRQNFVKCPCCWERFPLSQTMWIAAHHELKDDYFIDEQSGSKTEQKRFLPERFSPNCRAIDARGETCERKFACPHCHVQIPSIYFDYRPKYVSIVGTSRAGKTYFLAALLYRLTNIKFIEDYGLDWSFVMQRYISQNDTIEKNVNTLFGTGTQETITSIASTLFGELEKTITDSSEKNRKVALPFIYELKQDSMRYALCLYDHSGESFFYDKIGKAENTFIGHILDNDVLFFLYDPTQTADCVKDYAARHGRQIYRADGTIDVETLVGAEPFIVQTGETHKLSHNIFGEMAQFIREYSKPSDGLIDAHQYTKHVCIIVTKCDAWEKCLSETTQKCLKEPPNSHTIDNVSKEVESWIGKHDSAFTNAVKSFVRHYTYIPVSATGRQPIKTIEGAFVHDTAVEPLHPYWVDAPFICALYDADKSVARSREQ